MQWWVLHRYRAYARGCLLSAVFLAPLTVHLGIQDIYQLPKLSVLWLLAVLALVLLIAWSVESREWFPRPQVAYATVAFLVACALSTAFSHAPLVSLVGLNQRFGGLIPLLLYVALAFVVVALYSGNASDLAGVAWAAVLGSAFVGAYALVQAADLDPLQWIDPVTGSIDNYPGTTIGNSNFAGGYLSIVLPLAIYLLFTSASRWRQAVAGSVAAIDALALWYTHSRGGLIAAVAGVIAFALVGYRWTRRKKAVAATAALLVAALGMMATFQHGSLGTDSISQSTRLRTSTLESRIDYWAAAGRIFLDHPIVGTGLDTFYSSFPPYRSDRDGAEWGRALTDKPHNIFFEYAANTGLLGLGSYLTLISLALRNAFRSRRSVEGHARLLVAAFTGSFVAYLVQGFFSIDVPILAQMGWVLLGCLVVTSDPGVIAARQARAARSAAANAGPLGSSRPSGNGVTGRQMRWPIHMAVGGVAVALLVLGARPLLSAAAANDGRFAEARRLDPLRAAHANLAGDQALLRAVATRDSVEKRSLYEEAITNFQAALRIQRNDVTLLVKMASVNTSWAEALDPGRFSEAEEWWGRARERDPTNVFLRDSHERAVATIRAAVTRMEAAVIARQDDVSGWIAVARAHLAVQQPERARSAVERALALDPSNRQARALSDRIPP